MRFVKLAGISAILIYWYQMNEETIFFSYARDDASNFAIKLARDLKNAGVNVWIDQLDIPPGRPWDIEIEKALEKANGVIFILSEKSVSSDNVLNEIGYALDEEKHVIPVLLRDCKIPIRIRRLQHIDFRFDYVDALAKLLKELQVADKEETLWKAVKKEHSEKAYKQYLDIYPHSKYVQEANTAIKQLMEERSKKKVDKRKLLGLVAAALTVSILLAIIVFSNKGPIKEGSFECSNLAYPDSMWVIRARVNGNYAVYDKKLNLKLQSGWITLSKGRNRPQEKITIVSIRPNLVSFTNPQTGYWDYVARGEKQIINKILSENDTLRLEEKAYKIGFLDSVNLNRSWVVFDVVIRSDTQTEGLIPLQSLPDLF
ncbi:hypothetical protein GCM10023189_38070 [Nibrella saemangeumensis]|uniref:TIR domain-containing protein n=1 Tax=Nibrella saemangeumensis TaxID=1084526 RepID=A0ABP8N9N9_9BACT